MPTQRLLAAFILLAFVTACEARNLYVAHKTVIGVNGSVNLEQTRGHLLVGYDRNFTTIVPNSIENKDGAKIEKEAMAALSCSELTVEGLFLTGFTETLATGKAARKAAKKLAKKNGDAQKIRELFSCF